MFFNRQAFNDCFTQGEVISDNLASPLQVLQHNSIRWMQSDTEYLQAAIDTDNPATPVIAYVQAMMMSLAMGNVPRRLLNLGVGGGAVERFIAEHVRDCKTESVELNGDILQAARTYFGLPEGATMYEVDAFAFILQCTERYDFICVDLFGSANCQTQLMDETLWKALCERVDISGCLVMNLLLTEQSQLIQVVTLIRQFFSHVVIFHIEDFQNVVIYCRHEPFMSHMYLQRNADALTGRWGLDFNQLLPHLTYLPEPVR